MRRLAGFAVAIVLIAAGVAAGSAQELADGTGRLWDRLPVTGGRIDDAEGEGATKPARRQRNRASASRGHALIATVRRTTALRASPRGPALARLGTRTAFAGPQMLAVVRRRRGWVSVLHDALPNGAAGWLRARDVRVTTTPWRLRVDRSDRMAVLLRGRRVVERFRVGIGTPTSPTPLGRFAITDRMVTRGASKANYGCCILALSGRQPSLPAGWRGGDRLALHGSPGDADIGAADTAGCMTARSAVLRRLLRRVPVGTRVDVRR